MAIRGRISIQPWRGVVVRCPVVATISLIAILLAGCSKVPGLWTYQDKKQAAAGRPATFSATKYVTDIWSSKVQPTVQQRAVDASTLLAAIAAGPAAAGVKYGHQSGTGSPFSYLIKGTGTVERYDATQPTGPITVRLATTAKSKTLTIITGPVFFGTALRDAVGFIQFSQFTNQIDYADVATQLNDKVRTAVVAGLAKGALKGKTISFDGAFSYLPGAPISVIPVHVKVAP